MKAILISIKPKWVADILNHKKTIEVRKSMPKCDLPIDVYIYCTKNGGEIINFHNLCFGSCKDYVRNGKVVAKFTMYGCLPMKPKNIKNWKTQLDNACLTEEEYLEYSKGKDTYQWVIDDLVIFDKPKKLSEFYKVGAKEEYEHIMSIDERQAKPYIDEFYRLTKAPQSMCYIEVE